LKQAGWMTLAGIRRGHPSPDGRVRRNHGVGALGARGAKPKSIEDVT
jgi:hypothetical protein